MLMLLCLHGYCSPLGQAGYYAFVSFYIYFFLSAFYFTQNFYFKKTTPQLLLHLLWAYTPIFNFVDIHMHCSKPCHVFPLGVPSPWCSLACCTVVIFGTSLHFSSCTPLLYFLILLVLSCRTAKIGYFGSNFSHLKGSLCLSYLDG